MYRYSLLPIATLVKPVPIRDRAQAIVAHAMSASQKTESLTSVRDCVYADTQNPSFSCFLRRKAGLCLPYSACLTGPTACAKN